MFDFDKETLNMRMQNTVNIIAKNIIVTESRAALLKVSRISTSLKVAMNRVAIIAMRGTIVETIFSISSKGLSEDSFFFEFSTLEVLS